jgi:hypothetical protein
MATDDTRKLLRAFGVAVTNLEDALDAGAPAAEIARLDEELANRAREVIALVERLRSRRIA